MATHASILAWWIPWTEESVGQSMGSQRVRHNWATNTLCLHTTPYNTSIPSSYFLNTVVFFLKILHQRNLSRLEVSSIKGLKQALLRAERIATLSVKCGMWRASDFHCHCERLYCNGMQEGAFRMIILWFLKSLNYAKGDIWPILSTMWRGGGDFVFKCLSSLIILKDLCLWRGLLPPPPMRGALGHFLRRR